MTEMTTETVHPTEDELGAYCRRYRPLEVPEEVWAPVAAEAVDLVLHAGDLTLDRVKKDLQLLGEAVRLLHLEHRKVALKTVFDDTSLVTFGRHWASKSPKSQENLRGRWRRLRDCHAGVPFRRDRRKDGDRVGAMQCMDVLAGVHRLESRATSEVDLADAGAFVAVLSALRARAGKDVAGPEGSWSAQLPAATWDGARRFAAAHGHPLTRADLRAAVVHEVLTDVTVPAAVVVRRGGLTRRELDLALTHATAEPGSARRLLRGR